MNKVDKKNVDAAAKLFAQSFCDDPLYKYLFPRAKTRETKAYYYFRFELMSNIDSIYELDGLKAITVVLNPHQRANRVPFAVTAKTFFKIGLIPLIKFSIYLRKNSTQLRLFHLSGEKYLDLLAVNKEYRGQGYADKLLKEIGDGVFLETQNPCNVSLYAKYGFKLLSEIPLNKKGLHYYLMAKSHTDLTQQFQTSPEVMLAPSAHEMQLTPATALS